jgi:hypothetical protein
LGQFQARIIKLTLYNLSVRECIKREENAAGLPPYARVPERLVLMRRRGSDPRGRRLNRSD